jgi:hypothetical protein
MMWGFRLLKMPISEKVVIGIVPAQTKRHPMNFNKLRRSIMGLRLLQVAVFSALSLGLVLTSNATAGNPPAKTPPNKTSNTGNTGQVAAEYLTALHQAKTLLDTAIHDYDGHRAKAVGEIKHAIHLLTPKTAAKTTPAVVQEEKAATTAPTTPTPGETQAQSDKQLKEALQILSEIGGQFPKNHPKAAGHVETAIEELNIALKIK